MKKIIFILLISFVSASATMNLSGNWKSYSKTINNGSTTVEDEILTLNPDGTFSTTINVNVIKGESYLKNLKILVDGIWKERQGTMVFVIKNFNIPSPVKVNKLNTDSVNAIVDIFKNRYTLDTIIIRWILKEEGTSYTVKTEENKFITYSK